MIVSEADGYRIEKNGSKYLVFNSANDSNEVLKKYNELCDGIKNEIETINSSKSTEYKSTLKMYYHHNIRLQQTGYLMYFENLAFSIVSTLPF